jgi:small subunit ribosomal protein S21
MALTSLWKLGKNPDNQRKSVLPLIHYRNGGVCRLAEVRLQEGESLESALRRFKRKVQQEDIIKEIKKHSFYLKPGEKKRVKAALARKRARKKARHDRD